jgi:RNA polymerase sigma factor (sigma-70 family)
MKESFSPTRWSLVARATQADEPRARAALDELCRIYWPPLCAFAQRWGLSPADAEDVTQSFFAELLRLEKFSLADASRGKLRTYLLHTFTRRLLNHRERSHESRYVSLSAGEADSDEPAVILRDPQTPELLFNQEWAQATMNTALEQLQREYAAAGKRELFLHCRSLLSPESGAEEDYAALSQKLLMKQGALRVAVHRLRHRLRELVFQIVGETLDEPTESSIRSEIQLLIESLR